MYAVVRRYQDSQVLDALAPRQAEVEELLRGVPGFVAYYAVRSGDGGVTITICQDQAGTEESTRRARAWVQEHVPAAVNSPPEVTEGEVFITF